MSGKLLIIGSAVFLAATPAYARLDKTPQGKSVGQTELTRKYCFKFNSDTGSRISRQECRTKKEWQRLGVDVDELLKK